MNTLVVIHVLCMAASLILMPIAVVAALAGSKRSIATATLAAILTGMGSVTGFALLFYSPVLSQCIGLTAYLLATTLLYGVGFGWGQVSRAKLLKNVS